MNAAFSFLRRHRIPFLTSLACLLLLTAFCLFISTRRSGKGESRADFFLLHTLAERAIEGHRLSVEECQQAHTLLKRHPELYPAADGWLGWVSSPDTLSEERALAMRRILRRTEAFKEKSYVLYGEGSALIAEGEYPAAYQVTEQLLSLLKEEPNPLLEALSLLRMGFLAQQKGDTAVCHNAWSTLLAHPAFPEIEEVFTEGNVSMRTYLEHALSSR